MRFLIAALKIYIDFGWYAPPLFHKLVGYNYLVHKDFEKAEEVFEYLQRKYPGRMAGHEGLVIVAKKNGRWDLVIERLDKAMENFPDHFEFFSQQVDALTHTGADQKALELVQSSKHRFPDGPMMALVEAKCYYRKYDFQSAKTVLDAAAEKNPDHLELRIAQANICWKLGNYPEAKEILQWVRPRLAFKKGRLFYNFSIPYIDVLLAEGELPELQRFFENALSAKIRYREIILGYTQLLLGQKEYDTASAFLEKLILEKSRDLGLRDYAMLVFEVEKIKNMQSIDLAKNTLLAETSGADDLLAFLKKTELKLQAHPDFNQSKNHLTEVLTALAQLSAKHPSFLNTAVSPSETYQLALHIIAQIKARTPFSFIRLGDGEGHFLPYESGVQQFQKQDRLSSQKIWWGAERIDDQNWKQLEAGYLSAIREADLLGIPGPWRCCLTFSNIQNGNASLNLEARGLKAILNLLDRDPEDGNTELAPAPVYTLTSCHVHSHFEDLGLWTMIMNEIESCSVISCHPSIVQAMKTKFGLSVSKFYPIPAEFKYSPLFEPESKMEKPHFPDRFEATCSDISVDYPGEVFLVAAGFLGKFYCRKIKEKGGIALDVGSAADYWMNYKTRVWTKYPGPIFFGKRVPSEN